MANTVALTLGLAPAAFAFTSNVAADDTVVIGAITYTFKADPTGVAYAVDVGSDLDDSIGNLVAAINLSGTADDEYGAGTLVHPDVSAAADLTNDEIDLTAKVRGIHINGLYLAATSPGANDISAAAVNFAGVSGGTDGAGDLFGTDGFIDKLLELNQVNSEVGYELRKLTVAAD
jgi:hypothetical protein